MQIQENISLDTLSTFRIGGKAQYVIYAETQEDIIQGLRFAADRHIPVGLIGAGCNLLITDEGINGLIIKMNTKGIQRQNNQIIVDAGVSLAGLVAYGQKYDLGNMEWAAAVPASVGGAIRGNAGAFGGETKDTLKSVSIYRNGKKEEIDRSAIDFQYRFSTFKEDTNTDIILGATFELAPYSADQSRQKVREYIITKSQKQPTGVACSGCIFKNYTGEMNSSLYDMYPELEHFVAKKVIPSGYLIEKAGLKGIQQGNIQINPIHSNYMVNLGGGTYSDVIALIKRVKAEVYQRFQVILEEEVVYLHNQIKYR
jgi:UDP-N-acetylmuramate dehydrogenase